MCHRLNEYERTLLLLARVEELSPADDKLLFDWRFKDPTRYEKHFIIKAVVVFKSLHPRPYGNQVQRDELVNLS